MSEKKKQVERQAQIIKERDLEPGQDDRSLVGSLNNIEKVIAIMSGKGGVGKSTVTALLACGLAREGFKVGVLDADITGPSQGRAFGLKPEQVMNSQFGLTPPRSQLGIKLMSINFFLPREDDPVIWRGPLLAGAVRQFYEEVNWEDLDYLLVDLPPGTGDVPLTVMQSLPLNSALLVSSPQELALMVVRKTLKMAENLNVPVLGLLENMSYLKCPECGERLEIFGPSRSAETAEEFGLPFIGALAWDPGLNAVIDQGAVDRYKNPELAGIMDNFLRLAEGNGLIQ